jgi:DNA-binding Lrp family transcriptional regulator
MGRWGCGKLGYPIPRGSVELDDLDKRLINLLQKDCRTTLNVLASRLRTSNSTVHYRIRRLETEQLIEGYYARINAGKVKKAHAAIVLTRAKPGLGSKGRVTVARQIAAIPGIWAVYAVFGEYDYIFIVRANDGRGLGERIGRVAQLPSIERTCTLVVDIPVKEDPRIELEEKLPEMASKRAA